MELKPDIDPKAGMKLEKVTGDQAPRTGWLKRTHLLHNSPPLGRCHPPRKF